MSHSWTGGALISQWNYFQLLIFGISIRPDWPMYKAARVHLMDSNPLEIEKVSHAMRKAFKEIKKRIFDETAIINKGTY